MRTIIAAVLAAWMAVPAGAAVLYPDEYEWNGDAIWSRFIIPADDPLNLTAAYVYLGICCDGWDATIDGGYITGSSNTPTKTTSAGFQKDFFTYRIPLADGKAEIVRRRYMWDYDAIGIPGEGYVVVKSRWFLEGAWNRQLPPELVALAPVPLPAAGGILLAGLAGLFGIRRAVKQ